MSNDCIVYLIDTEQMKRASTYRQAGPHDCVDASLRASTDRQAGPHDCVDASVRASTDRQAGPYDSVEVLLPSLQMQSAC